MAECKGMINNLEASIKNVEIEEEVAKTFNADKEECAQNLTVTHLWIKKLISQSMVEDTQSSSCTAVNGFYLPELVLHLERIGKEFPISTAACLPEKQKHASTAVQERYFSELKRKTFEGIPLPCVAHRFLKEHIDDLQCGTNEMASKLKHFNHKHRKPISCSNTRQEKYEPMSKCSSPRTDDTSISISAKNAVFSSNEEREPISQTTSTPDGTANIDFGSVSLLYKKAPMMDDSDLRKNETWMGLCNEETVIDVDELDPNNEEHQTNSAEASHEQLDLNRDNKSVFEPIDSISDLNNNSFLEATLLDHSYSLLMNPETERNATDSVNETTADENYHQIPDPKCDERKPKRVGVYFQACPQIKVVNSRFQDGGKKGFLLKNGSKSGVIKIGKMAVDLQETCGFYAIMNLLQFGAINDPNYYSFVKSSGNKAL
ncbi:uncharacterized protein [Venturia canescens]|uniref:uncharacterized protein n=1 Tax=Venturia canescens TaxID=32260 RepID=UPI001C9BE67D|nr:uncharacterized protein LOC122415978 [Venturia canescens]XP_043284538.1 uncharacterized protein LOC122415978 [Venturia canescens]XP_043284540.1 uncharacterized protein LOC122415978 [Venturia canescens]XP_043284541.1 uncharacterized protein LOC122415978 [Venturia canescens]XP_043284542.1 uncharacterized protein LOC122415978 [Venturia canescens]